MSTARRSTEQTIDPDAAVTALRGAPLVRILTKQFADSIAAAGVLTQGLAEQQIPFQVSPTTSQDDRAMRASAGDPDAVTVSIGSLTDPDLADIVLDHAPVEMAVSIVKRLGADPEPHLPLAGIIARGENPEKLPELLSSTRDPEQSRSSRFGIPVDDLVDGLAHSLLIHAPFSGDRSQVADMLDRVGVDIDQIDSDETLRQIASAVAINATDGPNPKRAADYVESFLYPHVTSHQFRTLEGFADILMSTTQSHPGTAVALAIGGNVQSAALETWRQHALTVHRQLNDIELKRYNGVVSFSGEWTWIRTAARVVQRTMSPEPVTIARSDEGVAVAAEDEDRLTAAIEGITEQTGGEFDRTVTRAHIQCESPPAQEDLANGIRGEI